MPSPKIAELEYVAPPESAHLDQNVARDTANVGPHPAESRTGSRSPANGTGNSRASSPGLSKKTGWRYRLIWGIRWQTVLRVTLQLLLLGATIAAWALIIRMASTKPQPTSFRGEENPPPGTDNSDNPSTSKIFIHCAFGILSLFELIFLERSIFIIRAERYAHKHHGEALPTSHRRGGGRGLLINLAPWNRAPIPTYAAALAESGRLGTGDVEDAAIAVPPPPAYGNTRGSMLLLAGYLRDSLRAQRPPRTDSRPASYNSEFEAEWKERTDAERARKLEETLATLEGSISRTTSRSSHGR